MGRIRTPEGLAPGSTMDGGRTGIRTQERVAPLTVFKTVAFVRSATLPRAVYLGKRCRPSRRGCPVAAKLRTSCISTSRTRTQARLHDCWPWGSRTSASCVCSPTSPPNGRYPMMPCPRHPWNDARGRRRCDRGDDTSRPGPGDDADAAKFLGMLLRPLADADAAAVAIDYVTKDPRARGCWAIRAQHKLAGVDVAYTLEAIRPFGRGFKGPFATHAVEGSPGLRSGSPGRVQGHWGRASGVG